MSALCEYEGVCKGIKYVDAVTVIGRRGLHVYECSKDI
jgi:hypothetical protein